MNKKIDVALVVDCSGTLKNEKEAMESALNEMVVQLKKSPDLLGCDVYLSLVAFDDEIRDEETFLFEPLKDFSRKIDLGNLQYQTNPGPALKMITNKVLDRYEKWVEEDEMCFHPLVFFFTDGDPNPRDKYQKEYEEAARIIKGKEAGNKLLIVGCAFGDAVDIDNMNLITQHSERILKVTNRAVGKLADFFKDIIPITLSRTVTMTGDQLIKVFKNYNELE